MKARGKITVSRRRTRPGWRSPAEPGRAGEGSAAGDPLNEMIKHNVLMNIQQQTFNTYMWCRGFRYQPATGRMW